MRFECDVAAVGVVEALFGWANGVVQTGLDE